MSVADTIQELATDIGNAYDEVQTKGGTLPQNKNTNNLATAISTIPTGSTPTGTLNITQNGTYDVTNYASASVAVADSEFVGLVEGTYTQLYNEDVTKVENYVFQNNQSIVSVNFPNAINTGGTAFYDCKNLVSASFENAKYISSYSFRNCVKLESTFFPNAETVYDYAFQNATKLEILDLPKCSLIAAAVFVGGLTKFKTLILRRDSVCALQNKNAFDSTPFRNGTGGTVYVPQALLSQYQNATNWSALESTTFLPIEGSIYE